MNKASIPSKIEGLIFNNRALVIAFFVVVTLGMVYSATNLHIDAGFSKMLPLEHEYMKPMLSIGRNLAVPIAF